MKNKKLSARIGCVLGSVSVAVFSVFTFAFSPVVAHADTPVADLWDNELDAWLDVAMGLVSSNFTTIGNSAPAWYCSLQYMKYALNDNPQMITAGMKWEDVSPGFANYYNTDNELRCCMFPTNYDTSVRYNNLEICSADDFAIYMECEGSNDDFAYWVSYSGHTSNTYQYYFRCQAASSASTTFHVYCTGSYFTTFSDWQRTYELSNSGSAPSSYRLDFQVSSIIPTITPNYTPSINATRMLISVCGNYQSVDISSLDIGDIALYTLADPATLHDYLENTWVPSFEDDTGLSLSPVPDNPQDPTEPDTGDGSGGCNCNVEVNVEVNPTLELPSEWNEDLVDLETQHYTAPYEDMVIEPWKDLQDNYTTEPLRKNTLAKRAGEDSETDDYTFVAPLLDDNIIATIGDYELFCEQLFTASGIKTTVCIVLSAGFVIRFISLK